MAALQNGPNHHRVAKYLALILHYRVICDRISEVGDNDPLTVRLNAVLVDCVPKGVMSPAARKNASVA